MLDKSLKSIKTTLYSHREKEDNWDIRKRFDKLSVNTEYGFKYLATEIKLNVEVFEDETCKVLKINNIDVSDKEIWI
jgi:hypothetical protein